VLREYHKAGVTKFINLEKNPVGMRIAPQLQLCVQYLNIFASLLCRV